MKHIALAVELVTKSLKDITILQTKQILVIGNSMLGHHFVDQLCAKDPLAQITVLCGEAQLAYDRGGIYPAISAAPAQST